MFGVAIGFLLLYLMGAKECLTDRMDMRLVPSILNVDEIGTKVASLLP